MSNKRYIEFDSTYRNREQYPEPASFTVLLSQSGTKGAVGALDPVSAAAPENIWIPDDLVLAGGLVVGNDTNTESEFIISFPVASNASKEVGYYNQYPIDVGGTPTKIFSWEYMNTSGGLDKFLVSVLPALAVVPAGGSVITFDLATTVNDIVNGIYYIPDAFNADDVYNDFIVYNQDLNEWRPVVRFDANTRLVSLDLTSGLLVGWLTSHVYVLRKVAPQDFGTLAVPGTSTLVFTVPVGTRINIGDMIRFTTTIGGNNDNLVRRIVRYTGDTPPVTVPPTPPNVVTINDPLPDIPAAGDNFEILQFSYDNAVPLNYTGSYVSQQEMVCYEIELINLVLPNITLVTGGRIAFYPYVYVELQNISGASSGTNGIIYSNNPNARRRLFRCAIDDIPNPLVSPFIKIDGDGMVQTVKFKPNDNFKFGVYLPSGELFQTREQDHYSPDAAYPIVQISAVFSIKRL